MIPGGQTFMGESVHSLQFCEETQKIATLSKKKMFLWKSLKFAT